MEAIALDLPKFPLADNFSIYASKVSQQVFLEQFARTINIPPKQVILGAYLVLLSRYTSQSDLVVGVADAKNVIKVQINLEDSFKKILEDLDLSNHPNVLPTVEFSFNSKEQLKQGKELLLNCRFENEALHIDFHASQNRFPSFFLENLVHNFETLLINLINNPDAPAGSVSCVSKREEEQLLQMALGVKRAYPHKAIAELFEEVVEKNPGQIALKCSGKALSYRELNQKANQLARHLQTLGVQKSTIVGLSMHRSISAIIGLLAILKTGAAYVPIDTTYPHNRKEYMIENANLKLILTTETEKKHFLTDSRKDLSFFCMDSQEAEYQKYPNDNLNIKTHADDLVNILFTSGSTGMPKGVELTHKGIINLVCNSNWLAIDPTDRILQMANTSFDVMGMEVWGALLNGATLCIFPSIKLSMDELGDLIVSDNITHALFTARVFNLMVEHKLQSLQKLKALMSCGEAMSPHYAKMAFEALPKTRIFNGCGPTENSVMTCVYQIKNSEVIEHGVPIGPPIAGTTVYVVNPYFQLSPIGVNGELVTGGDGLARGYHNRADLTKERFVNNPFGIGTLYRTGDIVRFLPDGNIDYRGRVDSQVKISGFRIELEEIEKVIQSHPHVSNGVVLVREDEPGEKRLIAYIEPAIEPLPPSSEFKKYLEEKLPNFMVPTFIIVLKKLPLTPNGKIDRRALPEPEVLKREISDIEKPSTSTEKLISELWSSYLKIVAISKKDNFFLIGGNSIISAKMASSLSKHFSVSIPVNLIFEEAVLENYAKHINLLLKPGSKNRFVTLSDLFWIWRNKEVRLDKTIYLKRSNYPTSEQYKNPKKIFLTGCTGFVGAFMLSELLENTKAKIFCLTRAENEKEASNRIQEALSKYQLYNKDLKERIVPIAGDLSKREFGIGKKLFDELANEVDSIIHIAALVNHTLPYMQLKPSNVEGTAETLRLACEGKTKPLHFISTPDVFETYRNELIKEDKNVDDGKYLTNGYAQSKWVAEKLVLIARKRGLPVNILRLGRVGGHSKTGANNAEDFLWRMIEASFSLKLAPKIGLKENMAPVDFCCKAIRIISMNPNCIGKEYHLFDHNQTAYLDIFKSLADNGYPMTFVPYNEWVKSLVKFAGESNNARLQASAVLFSDVDLQHSELFPQFDCSNMQMALKESKLQIQPLNFALLQKGINYFRSIGLLSP
ncbi:MAG: amino acid adenylation domain-containing protein [Chlamydiales bacterium]|nr:amino acid adenylation domain-containing protein [Chlamydiales bacterium]